VTLWLSILLAPAEGRAVAPVIDSRWIGIFDIDCSVKPVTILPFSFLLLTFFVPWWLCGYESRSRKQSQTPALGRKL